MARLDPPVAARILRAIDALPDGDVIALAGGTTTRRRYRLRVGDWRVIFATPEPGAIAVERVAHRREVYR